MKLSISNIAWEISEDESIAKILNINNISQIDIAPSKYFNNIKLTEDEKIIQIRNYWTEKGITISGIQSLLYNTYDLNIFTYKKGFNELILEHLEQIMHISNLFGAKYIIFGSPKNRDRMNLSEADVISKSISFFRTLGDLSMKYGLKVCLEPNPTIYNCNFMTNTYETAEIVRKTDHECICLNLDIGAINVNKENIENVISDCYELISYVHLSEPNLTPLYESNFDYKKTINLINQYLPSVSFSIEMVGNKEISNIQNVEKSIKFIKQFDIDE